MSELSKLKFGDPESIAIRDDGRKVWAEMNVNKENIVKIIRNIYSDMLKEYPDDFEENNDISSDDIIKESVNILRTAENSVVWEIIIPEVGEFEEYKEIITTDYEGNIIKREGADGEEIIK